MKKIININLSGRVIPIEDSAYQLLQEYIESLRRYFAHEEGRDEIIGDIESRVAELMSEQLRKGATHITDADVNDIVGTIGRPEDFDATEEGTETNKQNAGSSYSADSRSAKRMYRNTSDKFLGGVCSGIANYLNIDPAIIRILFAIIALGGFGVGVVAYILLWIFLPAKDLEGFGGKRLYRNPDDKVFGGVAGGLAAYFDRRTWEIRLIFLAPLLLNILIGTLDGFSWHDGVRLFPNLVFGSLTSTFCIAYIILWMVLPEARTQYQKMEMRGEPVDLNTIRQNVKEGMEQMKEKMKGWGKEVNESAAEMNERIRKNFNSERSKQFGQEFSDAARRTGSGVGHAIGVLFKVLFIFIFGSIAFALLATFIVLLFGGVAWWPINNFLWTSDTQKWYVWSAVIFFLVVPVIGLVIWTIRRIVGVRSKSNYLGWTFGLLWTIGWVVMILAVSSVMRDLQENASAPLQEVTVTQPRNNKMILTVNQPELVYSGNFAWVDGDWDGWDMNADSLRLAWVNFDIDRSDDSLYHVYLERKSAGRTEAQAQERASRLVYNVRSIDSLLDLDNGITIDKQSKFRFQNVTVRIKVPVGKKIRFDESVRRKLNTGEVRYEHNRRGRIKGVHFDHEDHFWWASDTDYTMQADGTLTDSNGNKASRDYNDGDPNNNRNTNRDGYRYNEGPEAPVPPVTPADNNDKEQIKKQIEEEKRKQKESEERIKALEKQQATGKASFPLNRVSDSSPSVIALVSWS